MERIFVISSFDTLLSELLKKCFIIIVFLLLPKILTSQVCIKLYQGDDFGLNDVESTVNELEIDNSGTAWFALKTSWGGYGVGKFNGTIWSTVSTSFLPDPRCSGIAFDKQDSVWIGTVQGLGIIHRSTLEGRKMTTANSLLPESNVTAIAIDSNNIKWIGFSSGKVASYDGVTFTEHKEWNNSPVNDIEIAYDSAVWVGLGDSPGIVVYKDGVWTLNSIVRNVPSIESDKWGRVMVASGDSMIIYNDGIVAVVHTSTGNSLRDIAVGENSGIWASSGQGLLLRSGKRFIPFSNNNSAVPSELSDPIAIDQESQLWFGYSYLVGFNGFSATGYLTRASIQEPAIITSDKPSFTFCYGDSITLIAESNKISYHWPDGSGEVTYKVYDTDTIYVAVEEANHCFYYDTVITKSQKVYQGQEICLVSVDQSGNNIIVWEKSPDPAISSYSIYRSTSEEEFVFQNNITAEEMSQFSDAFVDSSQFRAKYKISVVDTCGNESELSLYQNPIYLQTIPSMNGINLSWSNSIIEGGTHKFNNYQIYRGSDSSSLSLIAEIPNTLNTYSDTDPTALTDKYYYQVGGVLSDPCIPTSGKKADVVPISISMSNIVTNQITPDPNSCLITNLFIEKNDITCSDSINGIIDLTITDPGEFLIKWSTEDTTEDISNLNAGWYKVDVTDSLGCKLSDSVEIKKPTPLTLSFIDSTTPSYYGFKDGQAKVEVEGGKTPYYYLWDNSYSSATPLALDLSSDIYYHISVTDNNGCKITDSIMLSDSKVLFTMSIVLNEIICTGYSDGTAYVFIPIGEKPYTYNWDHDSTLNDSIATNLQANKTYRVIVSDAIGNIGNDSIVMTEPSPSDFEIEITVDKQLLTAPPFAFQFNNNTPNINDYTFHWNFGDGKIVMNNNKTVFHEYEYNGTYNLTVQAVHNETGCVDSLFVEEYIYCTGGDYPIGIPTKGRKINEILFSPNPFDQFTTITFPNHAKEPYRMLVTDISGKVCRIVNDIATLEIVLQKGSLKKGLYFIELRGPKTYRGKIIIE